MSVAMRNLLLTSLVKSASSSSYSKMMQCRPLQNLPTAYLPFPLCSIGDKYYCRCSHVRFRNPNFEQKFNFTSAPFAKTSIIRLKRWPSFIPLSMRYFSQVPRVVNKNGNTSGTGDSSVPNRFKKLHWKQAKAMATRRRKKAATSSTTAMSEEDINMVTSKRKELVGDETKGVSQISANSTSPVSNSKQDSNVKRKTKQQLKNKKNKEQVSADFTSEKPSLAKSSSNKRKKAQTPAARTSENAPVETLDNSVSAEQQSSKRTGISRRKATNASPQEVVTTKPQGHKIQKHLYPPTGKSVVVVESVTKAKVIQGYLGDMYEVLPSYGHVRDLAARSGSVRPDDDFSMVWEVPSAAWTHLKSIKVALNGAENLILASDPDREGEAIAWHVIEMLHQQDALNENIALARVVFHEITEASIKSALRSPREIDVNLVHAYLARRALDYLIGFNISPLLWKKLPGCQSAGRVQSAALSLICDREMEIDGFKPEEYWTVEVWLKNKRSDPSINAVSFPAHLTHFDSKKLKQFSVSSIADAKGIEEKISSADFQVVGSKRNTTRKNPPTPYITSTLQQDAANKLHFTATYTMKLAQKLYEGVQLSDGTSAGLITYMRTDGLHISDEAVKDIHSSIIERYGLNFASESPRKYFKKVKNAQEAHEAIRPTDMRRLPAMLEEVLDEDSLKLYALIWSRTMACQMEPAMMGQIQIDIGNADKSIAFRCSCSILEFPGFQAAYEDVNAGAIKYKENEKKYKENEGIDRDEAFGILSSLKTGDSVSLGDVELKQQYTQPPARYSEGSLVKKLEELGIGRPSTYASTLKVLQDRNYLTVKNRLLYPEFRGRVVSAFLSHYFSEVTDYSFTADMENELDNVSAGLTEWKGLLRDYWTRFSSYCGRADRVHIHQVEKMLEKTFRDFLSAALPRRDKTCPCCSEGTLIFKVSRFGAGYFIGCNRYPKCKYVAKTLYGDEEDDEDTPEKNHNVEERKVLGLHPVSDENVLLKSGPYGFYVQLGEDRRGYLPKRASLAHIKDVESVTLEDALDLLRYPVTLGSHPKDGEPVILKLAQVGFCVRHRRTIASVPKNMKPSEVTFEKALKLLSSKDVRLCGRPKGKAKLKEDVEEF